MGLVAPSVAGLPGRPKRRMARRTARRRSSRCWRLMAAATVLLAGMLANPGVTTLAALDHWQGQEDLADAALKLAGYLDRLTRAACTAEDEG